MQLLINVRVKAERDIKAGEVIELYPTEVYTKPGYGAAVLVVEATIYKNEKEEKK